MPVKERENATREQHADAVLQHRVFVGPQAGRWNAVSLDFTIVGQGDTPAEAFQRMEELLHDYLVLCARDGVPLERTRRPIPLAWRLRLYVRVLGGRLLHLVHRATTPPSLRLSMPDHRIASC